MSAASSHGWAEHLRGATVCEGRFTLEQPLLGGPDESVWTGAADSGEGVLVAVGLSTGRDAARLEELLGFAYPGFAPLLAAGPVDPAGGALDAVVTALPEGAISAGPFAAVAGDERMVAARRLAAAVAAAVASGPHEDVRAVAGIRPETIWVREQDPAALTALAPQPSLLWALRAPADLGVVPGFATSFEAPEVTLGAAPTRPDDAFSLAATFWWWATGEHPFGGDTRDQQLMAITSGQLMPWPGPSELATVLAWSLGPRAGRPELSTLGELLALPE